MYQRLDGWKLLVLAALASAVSLGTALAHRAQQGGPAYPHSALIGPEVAANLLLLLLALVQGPLGIYLLVSKRWKRLGVAGLTFVLALAGFFLAMALDAPTLLFAA